MKTRTRTSENDKKGFNKRYKYFEQNLNALSE